MFNLEGSICTNPIHPSDITGQNLKFSTSLGQGIASEDKSHVSQLQVPTILWKVAKCCSSGWAKAHSTTIAVFNSCFFLLHATDQGSKNNKTKGPLTCRNPASPAFGRSSANCSWKEHDEHGSLCKSSHNSHSATHCRSQNIHIAKHRGDWWHSGAWSCSSGRWSTDQLLQDFRPM